MTFHFTSPSFGGFIIFRFGFGGLVYFSAENATLTIKQLMFILMQMPPSAVGLIDPELFQKGNGTITLVPDAPPTFDDFWKAYAKGNTEFCGPKIKAQASWAKLTITEQVAALKYIPKYLRHKADTSQNIAYASTFLNQKTWE